MLDFSFRIFLVFLFGLLATVFHEFLHYSAARMLGCDAEFFLDHIVKSGCSKLNFNCKSIGLDIDYCFSDFVVTAFAPGMGVLLSLFGIGNLMHHRQQSHFLQFLSFLLSLFYLRSSLNLIITDIFNSMGLASSLRLSDEDRIQLYMEWNPSIFRFFIHSLSLLILSLSLKILGWKKWSSMLLPILIGALLLLAPILYL